MNFGDLKTAIANRLGRTNLTALIPDFVTLAQGRILYGTQDPDFPSPPLRIMQMLALESTSLAVLPTGYLEAARFTIPASYGPQRLAFISPDEFADLPTNAATPEFFTLQDGKIAVQGGLPTAFTFAYYKAFPALVADADTNWLLTNHPGVYLYAALIEGYAHIKDDAHIPMAARMYAGLLGGLIDADRAARHSGSILTVQSAR